MARAALVALWVSFVTLVWPGGDARAQQPPAARVYRIGFLSQGQPPKAYMEAVKQGFRELGYVEGRNLVLEMRSTDGSLDGLAQFADELVRLKVDVIMARASSGALAAKKATTSIPIVFFAVYAPIEIGLVPNLAHPGGNLTGTAVNAADLAGKRIEPLRELVPTLKRVVMLSHPPHPTDGLQLEFAKSAAHALGLQLDAVPVRSAEDFGPALRGRRGEGVLNTDTPMFVANRGTSSRRWRGASCPTSTRSSRVRSPATCPSSSRPRSSWRSTSARPRSWVSRFPRRSP